MDNRVLRKLQLTQFEILEYIDQICRKNDIKYSLYAGTLLGAVRHKGFIPWDDDLDICMPREDYNRFVELWSTIDTDKYFLQSKDNTPEFTQDFVKVRKYNTNFLQEYDVGKNYHSGIFIDIFPVDRIPNNKMIKKIFYIKVMLYQLMIREFVPSESSKVVQLASAFILKIVSRNRRANFRNKLLRSLTKYNQKYNYPIVMFETVNTMKQSYDSDLLDKYIEIEFEGKQFWVFSKWESYLKEKYGNYMQLPPEEEREWRHKPLIISFNTAPEGYER